MPTQIRADLKHFSEVTPYKKAILIVASIMALNLQLFLLYKIILCTTFCHAFDILLQRRIACVAVVLLAIISYAIKQ
jgi:hypothetical protein